MNIRISFNLELLIVFAVLVFISNPVLSQSLNVQKCLDINDPSKRLDCYDNLFQSAEANNTSNISNKVDKAEKIEEAKNSNDYGLDKPKEQLSITSKIISVKKRGSFKIYIVLENGQTWRSVKDIYNRNPVKQGEAITISEGFLSGHIMRVEGNKVSLRVRRVK
ncbi:hypothetical protein OAT83_02940 [Gammaproteobacteria bacterium]|nr:hypothetical protein [Gammaproteobacteria bacterium]